MNHGRKCFLVLCAALSSAFAHGSGFALYEPSAAAHALGGATLGKAVDPSANFINPATLSDITNLTVTVGFVTEHPRAKVSVEQDGVPVGRRRSLEPGLFWLPHFMMAMPLPWGFTFGLGGDAEYGLGTKYSGAWPMNWSTTETTVKGYVLTPNISYEITKDWSVGLGLRWLYFDFEQYSKPIAPGDLSSYGMGMQQFGTLKNHLHGDNDFRSLGWQVGTRYKIFENFSVGAVYKSAIDVHVKGKCTTSVAGYNDTLINQIDMLGLSMGMPGMGAAARQKILAGAHEANGGADAKLTLPQSIAGGFNWDVTKTVHFGAAVSWTEWSEQDSLTFHLPGPDRTTKLKWHDTWRFALAPSWDFAEDWTWMVSYIYDMDCTDRHQESSMLPPADRHILGTGFTWRVWRGLECTLSYACIFMAGGTMETQDALGRDWRLETKSGFCHAAGFSVTYRF